MKTEYDSLKTVGSLVKLFLTTSLQAFPVLICIICMGFTNQIKESTTASYESRYFTEWLIRKLYCPESNDVPYVVSSAEISAIINLAIQFLWYTYGSLKQMEAARS